MTFVVDGSVCLSWLFPDEDDRDAVAAYDRIQVEDAIAPRLWWFEVRNAVLVAERRKRLTQAQVDDALAAIELLQVTLMDEPEAHAVVELARRHRLTFYDAAYLELARRLALPLATLDKELKAGALADNVPLVTA